MPSERFDENTGAKAVWVVRQHGDDYDSEWGISGVSWDRAFTSQRRARWWGYGRHRTGRQR